MTTTQDTRDVILSVLTTLAPEIDGEDVRDDMPLRDQVDLDSMDWLNFLLGIHRRLHVDIPESEYGSLRTLTDVIRYVERHRSGSTPAGGTLGRDEQTADATFGE